MEKRARPPQSAPLIIAHRGGSPGDIDNSLAAFEHALAIGCDLIECDLRRSVDGEIVLYHDEKINGEKVNNLTLRELRQRIPTLLTLDDLLMYVAGQATPVRLALDLKERGIEQELISVLETRPDLVRNVLISTVHTASLRNLAERIPGLRLALSRGHLISWLSSFGLDGPAGTLLRPLFPFWMALQIRWCKANTVALQHRLVCVRSVKLYRWFGCRVSAWTVDDLSESERLAAFGVDYIATNEPWEVLGLMRRLETET